ncbi:MAG: hypothetical protein JST54_23265 [Deltaproteobacteria bacterium]|nr:hypothetical protein [Deltaproteobacteria bacterium]
MRWSWVVALGMLVACSGNNGSSSSSGAVGATGGSGSHGSSGAAAGSNSSSSSGPAGSGAGTNTGGTSATTGTTTAGTGASTTTTAGSAGTNTTGNTSTASSTGGSSGTTGGPSLAFTPSNGRFEAGFSTSSPVCSDGTQTCTNTCDSSNSCNPCTCDDNTCGQVPAVGNDFVLTDYSATVGQDCSNYEGFAFPGTGQHLLDFVLTDNATACTPGVPWEHGSTPVFGGQGTAPDVFWQVSGVVDGFTPLIAVSGTVNLHQMTPTGAQVDYDIVLSTGLDSNGQPIQPTVPMSGSFALATCP